MEDILKKRLADLADFAYHRDIPQYSDFLNLNEQNIYYRYIKDYTYISNVVSGGYEEAERKLIAFVPDTFKENVSLPITVLKISPLNAKFSADLNHRDFLGSILNLGIDRGRIGDILVDNNCAYVFVMDNMADYIVNNLFKVKNTTVKIEKVDFDGKNFQCRYEEINGSIASLRLDCILSLVFNKSRGNVIPLINDGKVFVNGRIITTNSYNIKENDVISVRGLGKFKYINAGSITKKGRIYVKLHKYI